MFTELGGRVTGMLERQHYLQFRERIVQLRPRAVKERQKPFPQRRRMAA
jgi:hypothetical protein